VAAYPHIRRILELQSHTFFRSGAHFVSTEKTNGGQEGHASALTTAETRRKKPGPWPVTANPSPVATGGPQVVAGMTPAGRSRSPPRDHSSSERDDCARQRGDSTRELDAHSGCRGSCAGRRRCRSGCRERGRGRALSRGAQRRELKVVEGLASSRVGGGAGARRRPGAPHLAPCGRRRVAPGFSLGWNAPLLRPPRRGQAPPLLWVNACTQVNDEGRQAARAAACLRRLRQPASGLTRRRSR